MSPMTMRQQLLNTGLFSETDTRALIREHVRGNAIEARLTAIEQWRDRVGRSW